MTASATHSQGLAHPPQASRSSGPFACSCTECVDTKSALSFSFDKEDCGSSTASAGPGTIATSATASLASLPSSAEKQKAKAPGFSTARLLFAHIGAALTLFLATTDATIVSTSLPTIARAFSATETEYTWVGVSYMLTQTACQPLYGRLSDLVGRKCVLFSSIVVFALGSLLCGAAKNITWLIVARGLSGVGGGGIVSCVWVITSEIVETEKRARWSQALSITWSCSAVAGPLLGGLFSGATSQDGNALDWRWAFYLNLPICFVAFIVLAVSLRGAELEYSKDASWQTFLTKFDFLGLVLFISGSSCIIVGFSFAASSGWTAPSTLALIMIGAVIVLCAGLYEWKTTRDALFPPSAFKSINVVIILVINFLHNFAFTAGTFYLARFYQVTGKRSILESSLMVLPYSLGASLASVPAAWFMDYLQAKTRNLVPQRLIISLGLVVATTGFGVMTLMRQESSAIVQAMLPFVAGIGIGMLFHAPYQVFASTLSPELLATGTSAFFLVRFTGATVGLALSGAVFAGFANMGADASMVTLSSAQVHDVSTAIRYVWILCTPLLGLALVLSLFLRNVNASSTGSIESGSFNEKPTAKTATISPTMDPNPGAALVC